MNRRAFLQQLLGATALTAGGLYVPTRAYSFLWNNPLACPRTLDEIWTDYHELHLARHRDWMKEADWLYHLDHCVPQRASA